MVKKRVTQSIYLSAFCQRKNMVSYILLWKLNPVMAFKPIPVSSNISCQSFCLLPDDNKLDPGAAGEEVTPKFRMQDFLKSYSNPSSIRLILELHVPLLKNPCIWTPSCTLQFHRYLRSTYCVPGNDLREGRWGSFLYGAPNSSRGNRQEARRQMKKTIPGGGKYKKGNTVR